MGNFYAQQQQQQQHHSFPNQPPQSGFGIGPSQQQPNGSHPPWGQLGMMNDATAQMGVQFGRSAVQAGQDYMNRNVSLRTLSLYICS